MPSSSNNRTANPLRAELLEKRKALSKPEIQRLSSHIAARFMGMVSTKLLKGSPKSVALYRSLSSELNTAPLETMLRAEGHRILFPRITERDQRSLEMVEVPADHGHDWELGPYGIDEPPAIFPHVAPGMIDIIIVPGVGFGESGERIGMGAGYYDRFLPRAPQALRVALCFDFQLLPRLDQNPWDQPVHWVVSDLREARTAHAQNWLSTES